MGLDLSVPNLPEFSLPSVKRAFTTGFVFELLNVRQNQVIDQHVMVLNPSRYTVSEPTQVTLTPTDGDTVIEETNGTLVRDIQIEGTFGLKKRSPSKFSSSGQSDKDGSEQFELLRNLFRKYSALKQKPSEAPFIKLIFHCLRDNDHFVVVPRMFETPRDAKTTRMHYNYRISLYAIGPADGVRLKEQKDNYSFTDALRDINQCVSDARGFFTDVNAFKAQIRRKIQNIDAILINVNGLITQAALAFGNSGGSSALGNAIAYPFERAAQVVESVDDLADNFVTSFAKPPEGDEARIERSIRKLGTSLQTMLVYPERFQESSQDSKRRTARAYLGDKNLTANDYESLTGGATESSALRVQRGTEQNAGVDFGESRSVLRVVVESVTTLEMLSSTYGASPELIVILNDLRAPYFTRGGGFGTLKPGDTVLVPVASADTGVPNSAGVNSQISSPALTLYGADFALDPELLAQGRLDFIEDMTHDADDAQIVEGPANVVQGAQITLNTEKGETQFLPDVGVTMSVGAKGLLSTMVLSAVSLQNALLEDDRIERIETAAVTLEGDVLSHTVTPVLKGSRERVDVVLPFGRAVGG